MSDNETKVLFDDWSYAIDCNNCVHWWDDSCNGVVKGSEKRCTAFVATRKVDIPEQINDLRNRIKTLHTSLSLTTIVLILHLLSHILG